MKKLLLMILASSMITTALTAVTLTQSTDKLSKLAGEMETLSKQRKQVETDITNLKSTFEEKTKATTAEIKKLTEELTAEKAKVQKAEEALATAKAAAAAKEKTFTTEITKLTEELTTAKDAHGNALATEKTKVKALEKEISDAQASIQASNVKLGSYQEDESAFLIKARNLAKPTGLADAL